MNKKTGDFIGIRSVFRARYQPLNIIVLNFSAGAINISFLYCCAYATVPDVSLREFEGGDRTVAHRSEVHYKAS
jgi:hypothetical protein